MHTTRQPFKRLMLAGVLAGMAFASQAAEPPQRQGRPDPARMEQRMAERQAKLKAELAITPAQEAAWSSFTASMKPPARPGPRPDRAEIAQLTTPQRVERMRALHAERDAARAQREQATLQFYAALSPDQQKVFDSKTLRMGGGPRGHGPHPRG